MDLNFTEKNLPVIIVGTGPAGLMAGTVLAQNRVPVKFIERHAGVGRKLLIAGSSGLNISFSEPIEKAVTRYRGDGLDWRQLLSSFGTEQWLHFIRTHLNLETFEGTSRRHFVKEMKASGLVKSWVSYLKELGAEFVLDHELIGFECVPGVTVKLQSKLPLQREIVELKARAVVLALGGASWEFKNQEVRWPKVLQEKGIELVPFESSNCGFLVDWPEGLKKEAEGKPLKNIVFESSRGTCAGELMITNYGLEGTPIYSYGEVGECYLDLKPGLTKQKLTEKLNEKLNEKLARKAENLSPIRRVQKSAGLCEASQALLYHLTDAADRADLDRLIDKVKRLPVSLVAKQSLEFAISSQGGVKLSELSSDFELAKCPGVYAIGEMLDWDTITGGYLIQACVSQGAWVGSALARNRVMY